MKPVILLLLALVAVGGAGATHVLVAQRRRALLPLLCALDVVLVLLVATAVWARGTFGAWMQEDGWIEWATVYAFAGAAFVFGRQALRSTATRTAASRLLLLGLSVFCLFVAGEEISWGQRLLAFEPPEIFLEQNYQQEFNVHNLLKDRSLLGFPLDTRFVVALIAAGYGVLAPLVAPWLVRRWDTVATRAIDDSAPPAALVFVFAFVAWVELAYPIELAGEAAELMLGQLFLASALVREPPPTPSVRWAGLVGAPIALGLVTQPAVDRLLYGADEEQVEHARSELDALRRDLAAPRAFFGDKKWRKKSRVHKRLFTAVQSKYFRPGAFNESLEGKSTPAEPDATDLRRDRKGYFLDPWNNPYWIHYQRRDPVILLYSFGPNRRRDTRFRKGKKIDIESVGGDDIAVALPVTVLGRSDD